jgi:hypothetical protein
MFAVTTGTDLRDGTAAAATAAPTAAPTAALYIGDVSHYTHSLTQPELRIRNKKMHRCVRAILAFSVPI